MSASREKQNRQANPAGQAGPKTARAAQQRKEEKRSNLLYGIIAVAVVVAVIVSAVWRSGILTRVKTAATIDGESYTTGEVGYFYQTAYRNFVSNYSYFTSYLGLNTSTSLKSQEINSDAASMLGIELPEGEDASMTWHDYFVDQALNNMKVIQATLKDAAANGYQYPSSVQAQYQANMDALKSAAAASGVSANQYLKSNFGTGVTEKVYGEQLMRMLQYSAYANDYEDSLTYSDSQLNEVYNNDKNSYDHVSYEIVSISGDPEPTLDDDGNEIEPTEEEAAAALMSAQVRAQALLDDYNDGGSLEDLAGEYTGTYNNNESGSYSAGSVTSEWLYDSARKPGDSTVLEDGTVEYVVVFHNRARDESPTIDIRHILITPETGTLTENDEGYDEEQAQLKAAAHAKAEEILAQWKSGAATEESFGELAMTESADGSKYSGGLYTEVYQGQMVAEFNDWCFDASRQPGDTGVVDTQYGAHVMYFSGQNLQRWQTEAANVLRNQDYSDWENSLVENVTVQRDESGLNLIG